MGRPVLLVDDDAGLASLLGLYLAGQDLDLAWVDRPARAREWLAEREPAIVLLDVMLPGQDGFAFCEELRAGGSRVPILMLTGRGDGHDRIRGLRAGADDYLPKPFDPEELVARIEAILRRVPVPRPGDGLDRNACALRLGDRVVPLTPTEFRILEQLTAHPGQVRSRTHLLEGLDEAGTLEAFERAIDIHVSRLRAKIEVDPRRPRHLVTVRGIGYRWDA